MITDKVQFYQVRWNQLVNDKLYFAWCWSDIWRNICLPKPAISNSLVMNAISTLIQSCKLHTWYWSIDIVRSSLAHSIRTHEVVHIPGLMMMQFTMIINVSKWSHQLQFHWMRWNQLVNETSYFVWCWSDTWRNMWQPKPAISSSLVMNGQYLH